MIPRLGLVLECAREGADEKVLTCLVRRLAPTTVLAPPACMINKAQLIEKGAGAAKLLLNTDRCNRVFIVWDLKPEWRDQQQRMSYKQELALMRTKLAEAGIQARVDLFCLIQMLETWIIADARAVSAHLSSPTRPFSFRRISDPTAHTDPKALLESHFRQSWRRTYRDYTDAVRIIQKVPDTTRLRRVDTFSNFTSQLTDDADAQFQQCGDVCNDLARTITSFPMSRTASV
jgi:hypothetical protein